jgi:hypothetical protein
LARDSPVFQAKDGFFFSKAFCFGKGSHFFFGGFRWQAAELAGVDAYAVFAEGVSR